MSLITALKHGLRRAGLGPALDELRRALPVAGFHARNVFRRPMNDGRVAWGPPRRVRVFDTFATADGTGVMLVGHGRQLPDSLPLVCRFGQGPEVPGVDITDTPHPQEGQQIRLVRFEVPPSMRDADAVDIDVRAPGLGSIGRRRLPLKSAAPQRYLTITTLMKDEDRFLIEWIAYYRLLGADHFVIYDNRSLRRTAIRRLLQPYVDTGIVTLLDWDYPYRSGAPDNSWRYCQRGQMHHALYKYGERSRWMLFIDVDEFIYPLDPAQDSLLPLLRGAEDDPTVAGLQFKMVWFGDSGHADTPPGWVIENYTRRDHDVLPAGREKCAMKCNATRTMFIHAAKDMTPRTRLLQVDPASYRINHYFATSAKRAHVRRPELNAVEDRGMLRFVPRLRLEP